MEILKNKKFVISALSIIALLVIFLFVLVGIGGDIPNGTYMGHDGFRKVKMTVRGNNLTLTAPAVSGANYSMNKIDITYTYKLLSEDEIMLVVKSSSSSFAKVGKESFESFKRKSENTIILDGDTYTKQ